MLSLLLQFQESVQFIRKLIELGEVCDALLKGALFFEQSGGLLLVLPEVGRRRKRLYFLQSFFPGNGVKDTP